MTAEDEVIHLRHTNTLLQEQVEAQSETIRVQQEQIAALTKQVQELQAHLAKDSHNSHLPPSSDRFVRQPRSLRQKSEYKPGGQEGHAGTTLALNAQPDEIMVQRVQRCQSCQCELYAVAPCAIERWQVVDLPPTRLVVREYQAEQSRKG